MCVLRKIPFLLLFCLPFSLWAKRVEIELQSGASITGEVLKKSSEHWVIDLGFTVLQVPAKECVEVKELKSGKVIGSKAGDHLYRTDPKLKNRPLGDLVSELGEGALLESQNRLNWSRWLEQVQPILESISVRAPS